MSNYPPVSPHEPPPPKGAATSADVDLVHAAAADVRHLHGLKEKLDVRLEREGRTALAQACFDFLPHRALLDIAGWPDQDIFAHDG